MGKGQEMMIKDLKDGDEVMTNNPITLEKTVSKIYNHFVKSTEEYGKPVLKITSINGREIICTDDHPFLTERGWVDAKYLNKEKDSLIIYPSVKPLPHIVDKIIILDESIFRKRLKSFGVKPSLIDGHVNVLIEKKLLPLYTDDERLPILARISGFLLADGSMGCYDNQFTSSFKFGTEYDGQLFQYDMTLLGFSENSLREYENTMVDKITKRVSVHHGWVTIYGGAFASLLASLQLTYGNRTENYFKPVPDWVMKNSLAVKREFLAGFQGGDGSKVNWCQRKGTKTSIYFGHTIKHIIPEHIESLVHFMNQLKSIFTELKIKITSIKTWVKEDIKESIENSISKEYDNIVMVWKKPDDKPMVELNISDYYENVIRYMDMIGYRYATTKSTLSYQASEFLKYKQLKINERSALKADIIAKHQRGIKHSVISEETGLSVSAIGGIVQQKNPTCKVTPKDCMDYKVWLSITKAKNNCIYVPIATIEPAEHCMVADFTTESDNHSFIANNQVVSNCGLVKNLTTTIKDFIRSWY